MTISKGTDNRYSCILISILCFVSLPQTGCSSLDGEETVSEVPEIEYNRDVRGILSENCFSCHGPDRQAREAGLRLDIREEAVKSVADDSTIFVIKPGYPDESEFYRRITSDDPNHRMPLPESNLSLNEEEINVLKKWIEQGAKYQSHWAFTSPEKPSLPNVKNSAWSYNEIDLFTLNRMKENGFDPSHLASKEELLRRVSFDITGLPPPDELVDLYLPHDSDFTFSDAVDYLLDLSAYGERMAMNWLDVARYADSHGYQDDIPNNMWPWRDWVIKSFNKNLSYDQFITHQLAGDLLPDPGKMEILATGFNRLHPQSQEVGIINEEYRVEYSADRVQTMGTAFLGLTLQCARCHDHKYDPISQKNYYQLFAFFDQNNDNGQIPYVGSAGPTLLLPDEETEKIIRYIDEKIVEYEARMDSMKNHIPIAEALKWYEDSTNTFLEMVKETDLLASFSFDEMRAGRAFLDQSEHEHLGIAEGEVLTAKGVEGLAAEFSSGNYINMGGAGDFERNEPFSFSFWIRTGEGDGETPVLSKMHRLNAGMRGYDLSVIEQKLSFRLVHGWPHNAIQVISDKHIPEHDWTHIAISYDGSAKAEGIRIFFDGEPVSLKVIHDYLLKSIVTVRKDLLIGHRETDEPLIWNSFRMDNLRIFNKELNTLEARILVEKSKIPAGLLSENEEFRKNLKDLHLRNSSDEYQFYEDELQFQRKKKNANTEEVPEVMVMSDRKITKPVYLRIRGRYDMHGDKVEPGVPEQIFEFDESYSRNRLGLAQWMTNNNHPLTARVAVNRYWQMFFGRGLVDIADDFGNQGSFPTHPDLLDWLAVDFMENGWDVKRLIRQMVMSKTYRQTSEIDHNEIKDIENIWLSRGSKKRMPAEMIRDQALTVSGLLNRKKGGEPVFPYQPEGLWQEKASGRVPVEYMQSEGDDLYRRSLYTYWRRTTPPPGFTIFDAPSRNHSVVMREQTSTPMQALYLMNDPIFFEAAKALSEKMLVNTDKEPEEKVAYLFKTILLRAPDKGEIEVLRKLYLEEKDWFQNHPREAKKLLDIGKSTYNDSLKISDLAAGTLVASTIMNMYEVLHY